MDRVSLALHKNVPSIEVLDFSSEISAYKKAAIVAVCDRFQASAWSPQQAVAS